MALHTGQMKLSIPPPWAVLPWPAPALLVWAAGLGAWQMSLLWGASAVAAWVLGLLVSMLLALACRGRWRQAIAGLGFPLASWALAASHGGGALPPWAWGLAAVSLLLLYPLGAWRDAPWFPTPRHALHGLAQACTGTPLASLPVPASVLDAGCGLGHGLRELRAQFPAARIHGIERSRPLRWVAAWCCPWAFVQGGDIWAADWSRHQLVYVFQRPESMARAYAKAMRELPPGGWLVSLEFEVAGVAPAQRLGAVGGKAVWLYRKSSIVALAGR